MPSTAGRLLVAEPSVRVRAETDLEFYRRKQNVVAVRHVSGDRLVAIVFGAFVFGEVPGHSPGGMVVQLLGLGVLAVGLREIARLAPCGKKQVVPAQECMAGAGR